MRETFKGTHRRSQIVRIIRILLFVTFVFGISLLFVYVPLFRIQSVTCTVDGANVCIDGVKEEVEKHKGEHIVFTKLQKTEEKIQRAVKYINTVSITRRFPNTLSVVITMKSPSFYVQNEGVDKIYKVDNDGNIYAGADMDAKHVVIMYPNETPLMIGGSIPKDTVTLLSLLSERLSQFPKLVTSIRLFSESDIRISFEDGSKAIMKSEDALKQLDTLQRILNDATMETQAGTIDVRFNHPVIQ